MTEENSARQPPGTKLILLRFASVGVMATLLHTAIYVILSSLMGIDPQVGNFAAYVVALIFSYVGQKNWTFSHTVHAVRNTTRFRFLATSFVGYLLNALWVFLVVDYFSAAPLYAAPGIIFLTPAITFVLFQFWVFIETGEGDRVDQDR